MADFITLATEIGQLLQVKGLKLASAESCTGGGAGFWLTSVAGSSNWYERGFVTYSNTAKMEMLGVSEKILMTDGAVGEACAAQMVQGALNHSHADIAFAITGIAGPSGGSQEKPVGTVWFAWGNKNGKLITACHQFKGERQAIRKAAIAVVLERLKDALLSSLF